MEPCTITSYTLSVGESNATLTLFSSERDDLHGRSWKVRLEYAPNAEPSSFTDRGGSLVFRRPIELLAPALHLLAGSTRTEFRDNGSLRSAADEPIKTGCGTAS